MTLLDRLEDAYHNGGGLNLSADDVRELHERLSEEELFHDHVMLVWDGEVWKREQFDPTDWTRL
jgi:hypothetical protein